MKSLSELNFDNSYARLPGPLHSRVEPRPFAHPHLVAQSPACATLLGLHAPMPSTELARYFSGRELLPGMEPVAQKYTGHQFGIYNPDLGDGRGILLGEVINQDGSRWDLHLKGAGQTPYSRMGDGRAVLRSSIREFLASEAMAHLGIPSTRALCIIGSDETVYRERPETGAMLVRVARTHIRFGHFEYLYHTGQHRLLDDFLDYVIHTHFPDLAQQQDRISRFLEEVVLRTARLMAHWQAVGFAHGVMNTDNFSIIGDTFDFGPFAFMDAFEPGLVCNHSDWEGRYAFNKQPQIGLWNLNCLALSLSGMLSRDQLVQALQRYDDAFHEHYLHLLGNKLGFADATDDDAPLIGELLTLMARTGADYSRTFRALSDFDPASMRSAARDEFSDRESFDRWCQSYAERLRRSPLSGEQRQELMQRSNPRYVLRNYLAQQAIIRAEEGDFSEVTKLLHILERPYDEQPEHSHYAALPPQWGRQMEISCSS